MRTYADFVKHSEKIADLNYSNALLQWDQEVYMPPKGANRRAQQIATLSGMAHKLFVDEAFGNLLNELNQESLSENDKKNVELTLEYYDKQKRIPTDFVEEMSKAISVAFNSWQKAKKESNFQLFAPHLEKLAQLKLQECEYLGYEDHPYNAMLDLYERKMTVQKLDVLFEDVKAKLFPFIEKIYQASQVDNACLYQSFNKDKQWNFGIDILQQMGYDFEAGRQDVSSHPFTTNFNALDVRVTTRLSENNFSEMLWSTIHEGGHALYEQGIPDEQYGLPLGTYTSLGIHESQSRLWENNVGRSLPFWKANYKDLQNVFPEQLGNVSLESFYKAINKVMPSPIRTNADELTYHFHVLIRYEIEKALFEKSIKINELNHIWNEQYKKYLDLDIQKDSEGILQDIHWSHGSFGYFPTYSIGSFYAAQFYAKAKQEISGLEDQMEHKKTSDLLNWLRKNIHQYGQKYTAEELCKKVTGEELNFDHFMQYTKDKYNNIYHL